MNTSKAHKIFTKSAALLLILGLLLPSALKAKQLVDFCMMEMNHHEMMDDSHDCCISDQTNQEATHKDNECEGTQICACTVDITQTNNQFRVPTAKSTAATLSQTGFNFMVTSPDEFIYEDYFADALEHSPPLYLQYDTFLN